MRPISCLLVLIASLSICPSRHLAAEDANLHTADTIAAHADESTVTACGCDESCTGSGSQRKGSCCADGCGCAGGSGSGDGPCAACGCRCQCGNGCQGTSSGRGMIGRLRALRGGGIVAGCRRICGKCCCCGRNPPPGDMVGHLPYETWRFYYYYRPYQAVHVQRHQEELIGASRYQKQPYANDMFAELHRSFAKQVSHGASLEFADSVRSSGEYPFFERIEAGVDGQSGADGGAESYIRADDLLPNEDVIFDSGPLHADAPALVPVEPAPAEAAPVQPATPASEPEDVFRDDDLSSDIFDE